VDVAPGGRDRAAGEHAVPVALVQGVADGGGGAALLLADVQRQAGGVGEHAHHAGVAGQPAGGLGGDRPGEGQFAAGDPDRSAVGAQGEPVDGHPHLGGGAAHRGQLAAAQRAAGQRDQRVAHPPAVAAPVTGRPVAVPLRLQSGVHGLPADRVQMPGQVDPAVGADRHPQDPRLPGGVVQRPVRIDAGHPAADRLRGVLRPERPGGVGEHRVGGGQVDAVGVGDGHPGRGHRGGHHGHVGGGDRAGGVGGGQLRQPRQPPAVADQVGRRPAGEPAVPGQPRRHADHAVDLLHLPRLPGRDRPGLQRGQPVDADLGQRKNLPQLLVGQVGRVEVGRVQPGQLLEHRPPRRHSRPPPHAASDRTYERRIGAPYDGKPQPRAPVDD
jgi:hypothetical protein